MLLSCRVSRKWFRNCGRPAIPIIFHCAQRTRHTTMLMRSNKNGWKKAFWSTFSKSFYSTDEPHSVESGWCLFFKLILLPFVLQQHFGLFSRYKNKNYLTLLFYHRKWGTIFHKNEYSGKTLKLQTSRGESRKCLNEILTTNSHFIPNFMMPFYWNKSHKIKSNRICFDWSDTENKSKLAAALAIDGSLEPFGSNLMEWIRS